MSSFYGHFDAARAIRVSPAVVHFIENRIGKRVVSVDHRINADDFRFVFADGDFIIFAADEREVKGRGLMSRNQFEDMMMRDRSQALSQQEIRPGLQLPADPSVMHCSGTVHGIMRGEEFERIMADEEGDFPESAVDKFKNSLRKVYWYRRLKNESKEKL
jgi:hypothetical protein